jgi:hypothetical protein
MRNNAGSKHVYAVFGRGKYLARLDAEDAFCQDSQEIHCRKERDTHEDSRSLFLVGLF